MNIVKPKIKRIMIYVLLDSELCAQRRIFQENEKLPSPDGRVIIPLNEVNYVRFSLGKQELINQTDLNDLRARLNKASASSSEITNE